MAKAIRKRPKNLIRKILVKLKWVRDPGSGKELFRFQSGPISLIPQNGLRCGRK